jgi:hypothetical protein
MEIYLKHLVFSFFLALMAPPVISQAPLNWTRDEINPGEDFSLTADESLFTEGMKSCRMQLNSGAVPYLVSDVFYVSPGAAYEFSIDVLDHDTAGQVKIYADFYDTYGFDIFGHEPVFSSDSSAWQTISWSGTVPMQAVVGYILIKFYCQPNLYHFTKTATLWIDKAQFRNEGGDNLVANGGFEEWVVGIGEKPIEKQPLILYPNPAGNFVNIELPAHAVSVKISDLTGREIMHFSSGENKIIRVDITNLPEGFYLVTSILEQGQVLTGKLAKK